MDSDEYQFLITVSNGFQLFYGLTFSKYHDTIFH